ncbi:MAG: uroporphyrinogen-III C-methyltransferase [Paracoccaceae bacterium]
MTALTPFPRVGSITLVGAGPGAADLLTLRAVDRMRKADVIFYDRLISPEALAMAGPNPRRVFVGKEVGAHSWPQHRINAAITNAALQGQHVVRLKSGDPSVFGRACEEIDAARALGIPVEIIPGITAASAAAATLQQPLTQRGVTDRLVMATATCRPGDTWSGLADLAQPGTTLAIYMGISRATDIMASLRKAGLPDETPVTIAAHISTAFETTVQLTLGTLQSGIKDAGITNPAIIFVTVPKMAAAPQQCRATTTA